MIAARLGVPWTKAGECPADKGDHVNSFPARVRIYGPIWVLRGKRPQKSGTLLPDFDGWWIVGKLKSSAFQITIKLHMGYYCTKIPTLRNMTINFYPLIPKTLSQNRGNFGATWVRASSHPRDVLFHLGGRIFPFQGVLRSKND